MVSVAVRSIPQFYSLPYLVLLALSACGRFGFDSHIVDDASVLPPVLGGTDGGATTGGSTGAGASGGGEPGDAGGGDAGGSNTGGAAEMCAAFADAVVCEAFDDDDLGANVEAKVSDGKLKIESGSLRASIERGGAKAALRWSFAKVKQGSLYLRIALTLPAGVDIQALGVSSVASAQKDTDIAFTLIDKDRLRVSFQEDARATAGAYDATRGVPVCLRARIDIDESAGGVSAGIDAVEDVSATPVDTLPGEGISELKVGISASGDAQPAIALRIHDVVLDRSDPGPCL